VPAQAPSSFVIFVSYLLGHISHACLPDLVSLHISRLPRHRCSLGLCLAFCTEAPRFGLYPTGMKALVLKGLYSKTFAAVSSAGIRSDLFLGFLS
ncbi:hypothetical protein LEMLEM_LOCUS1124, partial [Lemmus lemmus]